MTPDRPPFVPHTILVVDDNVDAADSQTVLLQLHGYDVRTAYSGDKALILASSSLPDVVLLDLRMPGMTGFELARRLRSVAGVRCPLLVAVSGQGSDADLACSAEAGIDHHLLKPVSMDQLLDVLTSPTSPGVDG